MIFLLVYLAVYAPLVLGRARLQELRGGPRTGRRNGLFLLLGATALGFVSPALWLLALAGILVFQIVRFRRELVFRHRTVQFQRGNGPAPEPLYRAET